MDTTRYPWDARSSTRVVYTVRDPVKPWENMTVGISVHGIIGARWYELVLSPDIVPLGHPSASSTYGAIPGVRYGARV